MPTEQAAVQIEEKPVPTWEAIAKQLEPYSEGGEVRAEVKEVQVGRFNKWTNIVVLHNINKEGQKILGEALSRTGIKLHTNGTRGTKGEKDSHELRNVELIDFHGAMRDLVEDNKLKSTGYNIRADLKLNSDDQNEKYSQDTPTPSAPKLTAISENIDLVIQEKAATFVIQEKAATSAAATAALTYGSIVELQEHFTTAIRELVSDANPKKRAQVLAVVAANLGLEPMALKQAFGDELFRRNSKGQSGPAR